MEIEVVKRKLESAFKVDGEGLPIYIELHAGDEILSVCAFDTREEAEAQRGLIIEALLMVLF